MCLVLMLKRAISCSSHLIGFMTSSVQLPLLIKRDTPSKEGNSEIKEGMTCVLILIRAF